MEEEPKITEKIEKVELRSFLHSYYNIHLNQLTSAWIDIYIYEQKDPEEIVQEQASPGIQQGQNTLPAVVQIKAKEMLKKMIQKFNSQSRILRAVERRLKELDNLKNDKDLWQKELPLPTKPLKS